MISMTDEEMKTLEADIIRISDMAKALAALNLERPQVNCQMSLDDLRADSEESKEKNLDLVKLAPKRLGSYVVVPAAITEDCNEL